jgi:predicted transcriptional regulator of viral defense system
MQYTSLEMRFLAFVQQRRISLVAAGQAAAALDLDPGRERKLLSRLARRGLIARVMRGLYLVPPLFPASGKWSPSEALSLSAHMTAVDGRYQISGMNVFSLYGWDEQVPNRTFVYNDRLSGDRTIGINRFTFVRVQRNRLGGTTTLRSAEGIDLVYASKPRALVDAVYDWSRFNTLPRAYAWIKAELARDDRMAAWLVDAALKYGNQGTSRRIGYLLEEARAPALVVQKLERSLRKTSSFIAWDPSRPKRGTINRRWMLVINHD